MRKKFVYDKKLGKVVEVEKTKNELPQSSRNFNGVGKTKTKEIRALCAAKAVTIVDEKTGNLINVARTRVKSRAKWPIISEAMAIEPGDIKKAKGILRRAGVSTEYTETGEPILTSALHRKEHARAMGFADRNAGYGDPAPNSM